jgi:hypothetical protein
VIALIVKYIPRNEQSNTKKLLDAFREEISISIVEELDLLENVPDMLLDSNFLTLGIISWFAADLTLLYYYFALGIEEEIRVLESLLYHNDSGWSLLIQSVAQIPTNQC